MTKFLNHEGEELIVNPDYYTKKIAELQSAAVDFLSVLYNKLKDEDEIILRSVLGQVLFNLITAFFIKVNRSGNTDKISKENEFSLLQVETLLKTFIVSFVDSTTNADSRMDKMHNILKDILYISDYVKRDKGTVH